MPAIPWALAAAVLWTSPCQAQQEGPGGPERFEVGLWVDHQDYATPSGGAPWDTVSPLGLERIISYCRSAGATAIYFRGFGGGLTVHNSAVEEGLYPQLYDKRRTSDPLFYNGGVRYGDCDPDIVGTVVDICHRRGLRCLLYWPWEDTHNLMAFISRFSLENPGLWDERHDGYASPARLSLAFAQVRDYKLQLAREHLALGVDGFFIDYRRQSNWSPEFGYVAPARTEYERQYGRGPDAASEEWLRLRAAYQTRFVEDLRALCNQAGRPVQIIAAPPTVGADPMQQLKDSFVDWPTWVAMGLIDGLAPDSLPFDPARPLESVVETMNQVRGMLAGRCKLYWSIRSAYDWGNGLRTLSGLLKQPVQQTLSQVLRLAWENGAAGVQDDSFDPGGETPEWMATLRMKSQEQYRFVNPSPSPAPAMPKAVANYTRPQDVALPAQVAPAALEDAMRPRRLTTGGNDTEARYSPDGGWVVFQSERGGEGVHLWVVPAAGGEPRQLTNGRCNDLFPTYSPDGQSIAFSSDRADGRFYHIYAMPAAGGEPRALTGGPATDTSPCSAPDGSRITFTSTRGTNLYDHSNVLWEVPAAGGDPRSLGVLRYAQMQPSLSRDGSLMAFTALEDLQNVNYGACVAPAGDPVARTRLTSPNESCYGAAISPDGTAVAYTSPGPDRSRGWDIWVRAVFGDRVYRVTNSNGNDRSPSWSPDGRSIVFESNRDGAYSLYTMDVSSLQFAADDGAGPWGEIAAGLGGMVDGDTDPEHTHLSWGGGVRPALDYNNRSFGRHLGRPTRVQSVTIVDDLPGGPGGKCRLDQEHVHLYYGQRNGEFQRYGGPMTFTVSDAGERVLVTLGGLDLTATIIKVHLSYPDGNYTAVTNSVSTALMINDDDGAGKQEGVRVWTTLQGQNRLLQWQPAWGRWEGLGHELRATGTPESDQRSGEGGRVFLPVALAGDLDLSCQFMLPDNSSGAGGPVVYFGARADGSMHAFRFVNYWGTAVLQSKAPGQPWVQVGYSTGRDLATGRWHDLSLRRRGPEVTVTVDGQVLVTGRDEAMGDGSVGLGCQVLQVAYRHIRILAASAEPVADWSAARDDKPYVVVCQDAGRGGYQAFPGLCQLTDGTLLCVFYAGWGHVSKPGEKLPTGGAVALSRSTDGGRTWSPAQTVLDTVLDDRDPAVWQSDDGTVYVSAASVDWPQYKAPYDDWCSAYTAKSADNGLTWSPPEELRIARERNYTVWTEPRRLANGEWLWPIYRNCGNDLTTSFLRSTDGGHTWAGLKPIDPESHSTDEPDICRLSDGSLFGVMRPVSEPHMWQSRSTDNGHTWEKPSPLPFYGHCSNLLQTSAGVTLLCRRDAGTTLTYSFDGARTWAGEVMIDACGGAYSQMVELPDGRVLIVYYTEGSRSEVRAQFLRVGTAGLRVVAP